MKILVDADACPKPIKEILYRVAKRTEIVITLFANQSLWIPPSSYIRFIQVAKGFDEADKTIIDMVEAGDLVITADIPLASAVIEKKAHALNPRGEFYSEENIRQILSLRNFMQTLRESGEITGGPSALNTKHHQLFANALDRFLAKHVKK